MRSKQFNTDCEGPISLNDNAYELAKYFIPNGERFFIKISKYDDILADIVKRPGYKAGDTLKLILPFLKAYGASNGTIREYSADNIVIVPGADATLKYIGSRMPSFIISTSYEPYLNALCDYIGFDRRHVYCTKLDLDKYMIDLHEVKRLREIHDEIDSLAKLEVPTGIESFDDLPDEVKEAVKKLDGFFWKDILSMKSGDMLREINPVGGVGKANAILHSLKLTGNNLRDVMYIGDSITDAQALDLVKRGGGVAVSFNGNSYAINKAEIACISGHTVIISIIADIFSRDGKEMLMKLAGDWSVDSIRRYGINRMLIDQLLDIYPCSLPEVEVIREGNIDKLIIESESFRKTVRGKEMGSLG